MNSDLNYDYRRTRYLIGLFKGQSYRDYPLDRVLFSFISEFVFSNFVKKIKFLLFCISLDFILPKSANTFATIFSARRSYRIQYVNFLKSLNNGDLKISDNVRNRYPISNSIYKFILKFKFFKCGRSNRLIDSLIYNIFYNVAVTIIDRLEEKNCDCKSYVAFNSSYLEESLLCFYFRRRGITTHTFQHAFISRYSKFIPMDFINYENICAENFHVWGQYTIDQVGDLIPDDVNVIISGYTLSSPVLKERVYCDKYLVLLPRIIYFYNILKLLVILSRIKCSFHFRLHPTIEFLKPLIKIIVPKSTFSLEISISDAFSSKRYRGCIGFNSSSIFEAGLYGQNLIWFDSGVDEFDNLGIPKFYDEETFLSCNASKMPRKLAEDIFNHGILQT